MEIVKLLNTLKTQDVPLRQIFTYMKPLIIQSINNYFNSKTRQKNGRPRSVNLDGFLDSLYFLIDNGAKTKYIPELFNVSKGSFYRYLHLLEEQQIIDELNHHMLETYHPVDETLMTDGSLVKSVDGSEGTGRNPTDRGRKGIKFLLIANTKMIIKNVAIAPANQHDASVLKEVIQKMDTFPRPIQCLGDSGFVGQPLQRLCTSKNIELVVRPKKKRNGDISHVLNDQQKQKLRSRWKIEHLNSLIKRYRSLRNKFTKTIKTYQTILKIVVLCLNGYYLSRLI